MIKNKQEIRHYVGAGITAVTCLGSACLVEYTFNNGDYGLGMLNLLPVAINLASFAINFSRALDLTRARGGLENQVTN